MSRIIPACVIAISFLLSNIKCFTTGVYGGSGLHNCSTVFCSYDKLSNIYDNSKFILAELESILYDVRDEKNAHQSEQEHDKSLNLEIKFPNSKDQEDLSYLYPDEEYENESNFGEPVPYIIISRMDDDDFEKSILNKSPRRIEDSENRELTNEEQIDMALSRISDLEEQQKRFSEEKRKFNLKKYLR
ncbi:conserved Plasmodium protein, unknown function [Plasmodium knowlesi strain H]|uniref:Erythrocyte membrane antigen 1 n=3 Tax=Plasmodium knowlesi TaxID=5850 RepID=A0A5K1UCD0_PLAKH|nr:conserved Plasmodium protein, unknown function [Plasmodium knowlesi strain H]OTN64108.1 Uncharacterized protein PKNOH_S140252000 [Plasmodium knowlesi]CAA9990937.1 conserved Plasmodium protein, unknown function [Plasmodium knowlesi strain H]SBO20841.1 conserved Plasmodium protein, unknown function [Plasmodium knowlesi strain H]SBO21262.1 conserved Plasmodium protein, unknown function [Plasmodium knowlesi strain H]VVS80411.1 conserved Plasmodium protein, unknown function [Plasmodium knowlesi |eukprot:XP_002262221.1 hypothetical protein, conserved in Plasmodium species [Plasmodium knowlesi strain H]